MSVGDMVTGGLWIAAGVVWAAKALGPGRFRGRARSSPGRHQESPARRPINWQHLGLAVISAAVGVLTIAHWLTYDAARWSMGISLSALIIWFAASDLGSWRRSRLRRKAGSPTAGQP